VRARRVLTAKGYRRSREELADGAARWALGALERLAARGAGPGGAGSPWSEPASLGDVLACYRLLLGRLPDGGGVEHYRRRLDQGLSLGELVSEFVGSVEFLRAHGLSAERGPCPSEAVSTCLGFVLHVSPADFAVGHTVSLTGSYEPEVSDVVRSLLAPGATFVDVGANVGWFSMLAASLTGPEGKVLAFEPNPANTTLACRSAEDNGFANVEIFTVALADRPGVAALETDGSNGRVIPIEGPPPAAFRASYVVPMGTLDSYLAAHGVERVDVVKLDVEGAEPLVLEGARGTIERDRPTIVSEFYPLALESSGWASASSYLEQLRRHGYSLSVIGAGGPAETDADIISLTEGTRGQVDLLCRPL